MKNYKITIFFFAFWIPAYVVCSHPRKVCKDVEKFKIQFQLETDTVENGYFHLKEYSDNYFIITNNGNSRLCFNEIPVFRELDFKNDVDLNENTIFYFPQVEYFNRQNRNWELMDFYSLIGDSGEPLPMVGDSMLCLKRGDKFQFKGMLLFNTMHFQLKGKYRLCLKVFFKLSNTTIINSSNYHYFYVI